MNAQTIDIAVVGAGIMGLSAARSLARAGHQVSVFDQSSIPNPHSASYDEHRLIRFPYGRQEGYMKMVADAYPAWDRLWHDLHQTYYLETGTLLLSASNSGWAADSEKALRNQGYAFESLSRQILLQRYPFLHVDDLESASYLESGGILLAGRIMAALKNYVSEKGVSLHEHLAITDIDTVSTTLTTQDGQRHRFDAIIVAAGAWTSRVLADLKPSITPSRQTVVYLSPPPGDAARWSSMPMILEIDPSTGFYLVPPAGGTGLKVGDHRFSLTGDPDEPRTPDPKEVNALLEVARRRIPVLGSYSVDKSPVCFYGVAPDERFIVRHIGNTWILAGFSGHGFKFGPLIGERFERLIAGHIDEEAFSRWMACTY